MDATNNQIDLKIIENVLAGDRQAFSGIVQRYQARILRLCGAILKNDADAEDAAQEIFVKAYQSLSDFRSDASFYTWLYRVASNHCLSFLRAKKRRPAESLEALLEAHGDSVEKFFEDKTDFRANQEASELTERVLGSLRPNYRLVLTLREQEGLNYEEIAQALNTTVDSVKAQLRRARREVEEKLRHFLPKEGV